MVVHRVCADSLLACDLQRFCLFPVEFISRTLAQCRYCLALTVGMVGSVCWLVVVFLC